MGTDRSLLKAYNEYLERDEFVLSSYGAIRTISFEHYITHLGKLYAHEDIHSGISVGSMMHHCIKTNSDAIHLRDYTFGTDDAPCGVFLYKSPFVDVDSLGTSEPWQNKNTSCPNSLDCQLYADPFADVNSLGTQLSATVIQDTGGTGASQKGGGRNKEYSEWVLAPQTYFFISLVNSSTTELALLESNFVAYNPKIEAF